ncbi:MAG: carboxypeptidase-like regulatory domain-containing protein [Sulfurimonas sp.]|nr:carboxypeptidase-like regulatory domain-containing protein [Sulfurimonas sp.]
MKIIFSILLLLSSLYASSIGSFSLVVLHDGTPLENQNFIILNQDNKNILNATTDEDGYFFTQLASGKYQVQLLARKDGKAQAFVRKNVIIKANEESQIIVSLKKDNSVAFIDSEAPEDSNTTQVQKIQKVQERGVVALTLVSSEDKKKIANATLFVKVQTLKPLQTLKVM